MYLCRNSQVDAANISVDSEVERTESNGVGLGISSPGKDASGMLCYHMLYFVMYYELIAQYMFLLN